MKTPSRALLAALLSISMGACAPMLGQLRMDLNDEQGSFGPTVGGSYPESGLLDDSRAAPGHYDRSPSSMRADSRARSWNEPRGDVDAPTRAQADEASAEESSDRDSSAQRNAEEPPIRRRATRNDFVDQNTDAGSLWSGTGESNFFFSKNRSYQPGDIISISIENDLLKDIQAEVKRTLTSAERRREIDLLEAKRAGPGKTAATPGQDQIATSAAAPESAEMGFGAVDLSSAVGVKAGDPFMVEILERFSNGNFKIRGSKRVPYRNTTKMMTIVGIVRGSDLSSDEKIPSGKIYEYRLQVAR